jgi:tetratricopeptide (TPR) repeat protein
MAATVLALCFADSGAFSCAAQVADNSGAPAFSAVESLGLPAAQTQQIRQALESHNYLAAEKILIPRIQPGRSPQNAHRLTFLGGVYYLDQDYLHAAVSWKKSQAIAPLDEPVEFSLAMAYIRMGRADWARPALGSLTARHPSSAVYPYWLGRIDYDARAYERAVAHFRRALAIDPRMARAWDNLGLCYYQENANALSLESFRKAIAFDRAAGHPSPWPYYNLAVTLQIMDRLPEAEANLREALRLEPKFPQAHFQLGNVLEQTNRGADAMAEFQQAIVLEPTYAEAHLALGRLYRKSGQEAKAQAELQQYLRLRASSASAPAPAGPRP